MRLCPSSPAGAIRTAAIAGTSTLTTSRKPSETPDSSEVWQWQCGFYPGSKPGKHRTGSAPSFEAAPARRSRWHGANILPKSTEANFQASRVHDAWTREKYARFDCGERIPSDWRQHG